MHQNRLTALLERRIRSITSNPDSGENAWVTTVLDGNLEPLL
jgi:hypothetical protein